MARITKIEATKSFGLKKKIRVAAYARVSTNSEEQLLSLETQKEHYNNYITANTEWEYAGLYYDEGISGTKIDKREGLLKLLKDCEDGKIDKVITKSISRFARNTTDCLEMVRKLSSLGIYILFEKENIDTEHMSSELMLSILSSIAESESRSMSENAKWANKHRFETGLYVGYPPFGYKNENGKMVIIPEEAEIVKRIFDLTISGHGTYTIARMLNDEGVATRKGGKWCSSTVNGMLRNEKYVGDAIFQKTYTDDGFRRHTNYGEQDMYLCKNHHEAIISQEIFDKALAVMEQRGKEKSVEIEIGKYQKRYAFSGKIICGECGSTFKRRQNYKPSGNYIAWSCNLHIEDKTACSMLYIKDADVKDAFVRMIRKLEAAQTVVLKPFVDGLKGFNNKDRLQKVLALEEQLQKNEEQQAVLINLMSAGYIEPELYHAEKNTLLLEQDKLNKEKQLISKSINGDLTHLDEAQKLLRFVAKHPDITEFQDDCFYQFVDTITVKDRETVVFNLKCGLNLTERLG